LTKKLKTAASLKDGGIVIGYYVDNPNRYGVLEMDNDKNVIGVEEKPTKPKSNYAIPGLYYFDNKCIEYAKNTKPSARGEIEITSIIKKYIDNKSLKAEILGRGFAWLDTGTHESLMEA
jgi:glucose-1-phosphate thymidylyltransferase